jgi:signal transduction histidine kinase
VNSTAAGSRPPAAAPALRLWVGWRLRVLMAFALGCCVGVFLLMRLLADTPELPLRWGALDEQGRPQIVLETPTAVVVTALRGSTGPSLLPPALASIAPRWQADDDARRAQLQWRRELQAAVAAGPLHATLADGREVEVRPVSRGHAGLGAWFWPLAALVLLLVLLGAVVVLAQPHIVNALFALVLWAQALSLMQQAVLSLPGLWPHATWLSWDLPLRGTLDLLALAALLHALVLFPRRRPYLRRWAGFGWGLALAASVAAGVGPWPWASVQIGVLALSAAGCWVAWRGHPRPLAAVQRQTRWLLAGGTLGVSGLSVAALAIQAHPAIGAPMLRGAVDAWPLLVTALLVVPLMLRSRQVMREFALLASISAVAASLDLLFVAVFSLSTFSSMALVVFVALGLYAGLRQWLFDRLAGSTVLTTERVFEQVYRAARVVQAEPERLPEQLALVMRDLFEPLEVLHSARPVTVARIAGAGGTLLVPVPSLSESWTVSADGSVPRTSPSIRRSATLVLRHARRGQRVFTREDVRLADRVVEQLRRAVIYDMAVERGRNEERLRIAQDLHDDIGARLLTLMYQAPTSAIEDYIRDTLKDLKTLTRGLATSEQPLSLAMAEWRADIDQRCTVARVELDWAVQVDQDPRLGMVAWSGLTRVLRELVSNSLQHGQASRLTVRLRLLQGEFNLRVSDNGRGVAPENWAPGLGLGGVRKRVKLLGGRVQWRAHEGPGITCEVSIPALSTPATA